MYRLYCFIPNCKYIHLISLTTNSRVKSTIETIDIWTYLRISSTIRTITHRLAGNNKLEFSPSICAVGEQIIYKIGYIYYKLVGR